MAEGLHGNRYAGDVGWSSGFDEQRIRFADAPVADIQLIVLEPVDTAFMCLLHGEVCEADPPEQVPQRNTVVHPQMHFPGSAKVTFFERLIAGLTADDAGCGECEGLLEFSQSPSQVGARKTARPRFRWSFWGLGISEQGPANSRLDKTPIAKVLPPRV